MRLLFIYLILFAHTIVNAQTLYEKQIIPFDAMDNDYFGQGVAINDSLLFVSSIRYSNTIEGCVYVYKYENNNYIFNTKIYPDDAEYSALFGSRLMYQDGQLFVGTQNKRVDGYKVGALYVFEYENNNWIQKQKIVPPEPLISQKLFSNAIAKLNETLVVSAFRSDAGAEDAGKVFVYKYVDNQYVLQQELAPFDPKEYQYFGTSLVIKENLLLVGSEYDSTSSGYQSGSIYTYSKEDSLWIFKNKYIPEPNSEYLTLGTSMSSNNNFVFAGTSDSFSYTKPGKVYIYKISEPLLELHQIIESGDGYFDDRFGINIISKGDTLLVTALFDTVNSSYPGSIYMFVNEENSWIKKKRIVPSDEQDALWFGNSLAINNEIIFIGAKLSKIDRINPGKVYLYSTFPLSIFDEKYQILDEFVFYQNYPNPFNSSTTVKYTIPNNGDITIRVFDVLGQAVRSGFIGYKAKGTHTNNIDFSGMPSGVYFIRIEFVCELSDKIQKTALIKKAVLIN